ncbi:hypothetical protein KP509_1Z219100 [Ceratopteris richardii]|nr:hypothetical protein KP509_1Z219100 [Ceratopteris richardii]KAH6555899.1 hypothetical protein KP509_1Z219100 [Ceratopteris richardii]
MACSSITHYACCGHGVNRVMSTSSSPVKSNTSVKASTSSSCITTPQITVSSSTRSRFTHLTPLLSELVASSSTDVPLILDPWIPFLSVDDWRVLIADVGPKNWSSSLQVFYTFKNKSSLWNELQEKETLDDGTSSILKMYTTLIRVLGRKQRRQEIASVQKQMEEHNITADVTFYNALLMFYADNGQADDLWEGLRRMKAAGIEPDHLTHELLITGLLHGEAPDLERTENALKGLLKERFPISASTFKKLIQAFWKAADIEGAERTFTALQESGYLPDLKACLLLPSA